MEAKGNIRHLGISRNSGAMLHSQDPKTMTRDQDFPISIEGQLLGGKSDGSARPTMNVCTPGTEIVIDGRLYPEHCLNSSSPIFDADQWVRADIGAGFRPDLLTSSTARRLLVATLPQFGGGVVHNHDPAAQPTGKLIEGGYISLQSESHPSTSAKSRC